MQLTRFQTRFLLLASSFAVILSTVCMIVLWQQAAQQQWALIDRIQENGDVAWGGEDEPKLRLLPPRPSAIEIRLNQLTAVEVDIISDWRSLTGIHLLKGTFSASEIKELVSGKETWSCAFALEQGEPLAETDLADLPTLALLCIGDSTLTQNDLEYLQETQDLASLILENCKFLPAINSKNGDQENGFCRPGHIWIRQSTFPEEDEHGNLSWLKAEIVSFSDMEIPAWVLHDLICENQRLIGVLITDCTFDGQPFSADHLPCEGDQKIQIKID